MKKRTSVILVLISLVVMSVSYYLIKNVLHNKTVAYNSLAILFTICAILVLYIAYKELLRRLGKGAVVKEDYAVLYGLEKPRITGEVEFYFTMNQSRHMTFSLLDAAMQEIHVLADKEYASGGHIVRYDTTNLPDGIYFYCLRSSNQKTMKRMVVQHDKLAV
jgi:hypothetical protein